VIATISTAVLVAWLLLAEPWLGRRSFRAFLAAMDRGDSRAKVDFYKQWIWQSWLLVAVALLVCWVNGWTLAQIGFAWPQAPAAIPESFIVGGVAGIAIGIGAGLLARWLIGRVRAVKSPSSPNVSPANQSEIVLRMLPQSRAERGWFAALALTAGIGEEIVWRGFGLCVLFACHIHGPTVVLIVALALPFGWAHLYQGIFGILITAVLGGLFAALYLGTGSLFLPMILHTVLDLRLLLMHRRATASVDG
jgi:membrane protease YdiL (CAAX protease family)